MRRPRRRTIGLALLAALAVLLVAGAWYLQPQPLLPEAEASLASTAEVAFNEVDGRLEWAPADGDYDSGLVVYPGGKVPAAAYGPLAQEIAAAGYLVVITPMPLNLAVFGIGSADAVLEAHPEIDAWAIGGHSLGGSMAAQYVAGNPEAVDGLALWASYAATDLSSLDLTVLSTWGSLDAGAARMSGPDARAYVPPDAVFTEIPGGNHEQMGWYTGQPNDPPATITREEQQARVAAETVSMLERIERSGP
jgi:hypothetical protein